MSAVSRAALAAAALVAAAWVGTAASMPAPPDSTPVIHLSARSFQPGELVVVSMTTEKTASSVEVKALGQSVPGHPLGPGVWRALVGIDLDRAPGKYVVTVRTGDRVATRPLVVAARRFPVRRLRVNPDFVNPPPELTARIEAESRFLAEVFARPTTAPLWTAPFRRPVPHQANSRFGTRSIFNGEARSPHGGTDFLSPAGTPVHAPNAGRVVAARELYFSGQTVMLDHGAGVFSQLTHLSRIDVREGDEVQPGQVVGLVGATGRVTGAHLHWAVRVSGARVDALSLLALLGASP